MQRLYVVGFPEVMPVHAAWVERVRAAHDPAGYALLQAHFTFVFGCVGIPAQVVESVTREVAGTMTPIHFTLVRAELSAQGDLHFVYLRPDETASSAMTELHRKLHAGALAGCLDRSQIFTPHMTVCKSADIGEAEQVFRRLRSRRLRVEGHLRALTVGAVVNGTFERVTEIALGGPDHV